MDRNKVLYEKVLAAQSADETKSTEVLCAAQTREHTAYVAWSAGCNAGNVVVESAPYKGYTGVWAAIGELPFVAASQVDSYRFTGVFGAVRLRIETAIGVGTVDGWILAN